MNTPIISKILKYEYNISKGLWVGPLLVAIFIILNWLYVENHEPSQSIHLFQLNMAGSIIVSFGSIISLLSYPELNNRFFKQNYLMLPVSSNKKFLIRQLLTFIIIPLVVSLMIFILQEIINFVFSWEEKHKIHLLQSVNIINFCIIWIFAHSTSNLFANIYIKYTLSRAVIFLLILTFFLPSIILIFLKHGNNQLTKENIQNVLGIIETLLKNLIFIAPVPFYILTYILFKRRHI